MEENRQYTWVDLESGVRYPCTKEHQEEQKRIWEMCKPKFIKGFSTPIIFGTGGEQVNFTFKDLGYGE